ncbi:hypothetical protein [Rhizobium dioscoreae]|uniref:hypothetical protein n=1 Tax=Rhizobium TaxID=379 RepID=UPI001260D883|nr:hypothetical protein [Rhizobium dioscoreae]
MKTDTRGAFSGVKVGCEVKREIEGSEVRFKRQVRSSSFMQAADISFTRTGSLRETASRRCLDETTFFIEVGIQCVDMKAVKAFSDGANALKSKTMQGTGLHAETLRHPDSID